MVFVENIAVSGEYVETLKDKRFVVIKAPHYEKFHNPDLKEEEKRLVMKIELSDGSQLDYFPNKTSIKVMAKLYGYQMDNWIGKPFEFMVNTQQAFGKEQKVLYVCDKKVKSSEK